jgi:hypothetical protein
MRKKEAPYTAGTEQGANTFIHHKDRCFISDYQMKGLIKW